jgi:hypothetical protein
VRRAWAKIGPKPNQPTVSERVGRAAAGCERVKRAWPIALFKTFATSSDHTRHLQVHSGAKSYLCDACGKALARAGVFTTHLRVHTGERPYLCETWHRAGERYVY